MKTLFNDLKRRVVCAANRCPNTGHMILGVRHWDNAMRQQHDLFVSAGYDKSCLKFSEQGFVDQYGVFMSRQEAWEVAKEANQIIRRVGGDEANNGTLYSENLY